MMLLLSMLTICVCVLCHSSLIAQAGLQSDDEVDWEVASQALELASVSGPFLTK